MQTIKLQSSDNVIFETDISVANVSCTIRGMLEELRIDQNNPSEVIVPIPKVNSMILAKVIEFCTYHKDDQNEEDRERRSDDISPWDMEFVQVDQGTLLELVSAANYLDIRSLLDLTCKTVANLIQDKSPDEIRGIFNIRNDLTAGDIEQIIREHNWSDVD